LKKKGNKMSKPKKYPGEVDRIVIKARKGFTMHHNRIEVKGKPIEESSYVIYWVKK